MIIQQKGSSAIDTTTGKVWNKVINGNFNWVSFGASAFDGGIWVASGNNGLYYSLNGMDWVGSSRATSNNYFRNDFADLPIPSLYHYKNKNFLYVDDGIAYSSDGKNWRSSNKISGTGILCCDKDADMIVGSIDTQTIYSSNYGSSWSHGNLSKRFTAIGYGNNTWVASAYKGSIYYSTNGYTWIESNFSYNSNSDTVYTIQYTTGDTWLAGCFNRVSISKDNGKTWTGLATQDGSKQFYYNYSGCLDFCSAQSVYYSTDDLKTWNRIQIVDSVSDVVFCASDRIYVVGIVKSNYGIYYSTDVIHWYPSNLNSQNVKSIATDGTIFVACTDNGLYYSV